MAEPVVIEKDMGITHGDFFRIIGHALGTEDFEKRPAGVRLADGEKSLDIKLGPEGQRKIALMVIPRTLVTLTFCNYSEAEQKAAVKRFDMMFKKGGG